MKSKIFCYVAILIFSLTFCGAVRAQKAEILAVSNKVIGALKNKDIKALILFVHPTKGVRFSPYGYIQTDKEDLVFKKTQIPGLFNSRRVYNWGIYDGSGDSMKLNFEGYYKKFIYNQDFARAPRIAYNQIVKQGNTIVNISEAYPQGKFVEYHFPGTKKMDGMDWNSLRLIFEKSGGRWYLVGISHDQWTI